MSLAASRVCHTDDPSHVDALPEISRLRRQPIRLAVTATALICGYDDISREK